MEKHYLKSLVILAFLAIICQLSIAQTHSYNTTTLTATAPYDYYSDFKIFITNLQPSDSLSITWQRISNTLPSAWDYSICDFGSCFIGIPNGNTMSKIPPGATEYFKLSINPANNAGSGMVELLVYETGNQGNADTLTYSITSTPTGISINSVTENQITIFPNPAKDNLNVKLDSYSSINSVAIFNVIGKKIMDVSVSKNAINKISLNEIPAGIYFIQYVNENGTPVTQKFYKTN